MKKISLILTFALALSFASCSDDDDTITHQAARASQTTSSSSKDTISITVISDTTIEANRFVYEVMSTYYYWYDEMPLLNYRTQPDTEEYFEALLSSKDRFSYISNDAEETYDELAGEYTEIGWYYTLSLLESGSSDVVAIITYVYDDTPAKRAGVKRGDVIYQIDGVTMNLSNYVSLMSQTSGTYTAWRVVDDELTTIEYDLAAAEVTENSVAEMNIFTLSDGRKIAYLLYNSYSETFNDDLIAAFQTFQSEGVSGLILDLRYNTGGDTNALQALCSMIAPASAVSAESELLYYEFNSYLSRLPGYSDTGLNFDSSVEVNLDLSSLIVLTGAYTYSASEATIWSLEPYMDVTLIGDTTGGKNSMMYVMTPEDFTYTNGQPYFDSSINNWLLAPIVAIYKNSNDEAFDTSNGYGLIPDYYFNEYKGTLSTGLKQLGDEEETLTAAAIRYLETGSAEETTKSASLSGIYSPSILGHTPEKRNSGLFLKKPSIEKEATETTETAEAE